MQSTANNHPTGAEAGQTPTIAVPDGRCRRRLLHMPLLTCLPLPMLLQACQSPPGTAATAATPPSPWSQRQRDGLQALGFVQSGQEWGLSLATSLLFDFDSDRLRPGQRARLNQLGRQLRELGVSSLRVEGHSDIVGDPDYNLQLSLRRAITVSQALQDVGWPASALKARGFGRDKPIADNTTEAGRAQNRRVVLIALAA